MFRKPITEWPASLIGAIAITLVTYLTYGIIEGELEFAQLGAVIPIPALVCVAGIVVSVEMWSVTIKSYRAFKRKSARNFSSCSEVEAGASQPPSADTVEVLSEPDDDEKKA